MLLASTFYLDPVSGSMSGDGSQQDPWGSLEDVFSSALIESQKPASYPYSEGAPLVARNPGAPVQPGDTLILMSGDHGTIDILAWYNETPITIEAAPNETPVLGSWRLRGGKNWVLRGLTISPDVYDGTGQTNLLGIESHGWQGPASECVIDRCEIFSVDDSSLWSAEDWASAESGVYISGNDCIIQNCNIRNVRFGIVVYGDDCLIEYCEINGFSGDALRGLGDFGTYQYNLIMNSYDVDWNHDDAFQSWGNNGNGPGSGTVEGVVIRGNVILQTDDPNRQFNGPLQGIGCFDGNYDGWLIENNLIIIDQWHAIALGSPTECIIRNNTIVDLEEGGASPWINIGVAGSGVTPEGNIVANNIACSFPLYEGTIDESNYIIFPSEYIENFRDPDNFNFQLLSTSYAVDQADMLYASNIDLLGTPRPQGSGFDIGAYEYLTPIEILGSEADNHINDDGTETWSGNVSSRIGGSSGTTEGAVVYVFQLPELLDGQMIANANIRFSLITIANGPFIGNADLYGLPWRESPVVSAATDFYNGAFGNDYYSTPIQQAIMVNSESIGSISSNADGNFHLAQYLNAQYADGAEGGDYVFLRVNSDQIDHLPYRYWSVATADHTDPDFRPVLTVEIGLK
ncbi:right-handed parallel beta-helix repeat-containing protein [Cerasicoccus fimbriatus]|uniref:right-handed parallel beta-helix repeat-containing protein n=1 Tax=Cerasicoccus fimbriatus TaxID=3014554 RepID=UPI0022B57228|nr:right-handed parallel beta-helix repeat-containing protein [Cerasicoccus sp. TK19100]